LITTSKDIFEKFKKHMMENDEEYMKAIPASGETWSNEDADPIQDLIDLSKYMETQTYINNYNDPTDLEKLIMFAEVAGLGSERDVGNGMIFGYDRFHVSFVKFYEQENDPIIQFWYDFQPIVKGPIYISGILDEEYKDEGIEKELEDLRKEFPTLQRFQKDLL
jgi:hypothetical protein